jgi:hypothetical protein
MSATTLHEDASALRIETIDEHRAYRSLMEELEAIDWYTQRVDAGVDGELKEILRHNRDEEKEHAAMVLEWLRRRDPVLDRFLRVYLFTEGPLQAIEKGAAESADAPRIAASGTGLGIGSLREPRGQW